MSRLELRSPNQAQLVVEGLYKDLERRIESSPPGLCPVDMSRAFLEICHAQSCLRRPGLQLCQPQIAVLQGQLKQAFGTKSRLERQMDTLDINDAHYDRKILDLQRRYTTTFSLLLQFLFLFLPVRYLF